MAATATQVSQIVAAKEKEWVRIFPKEVTENYTSSVTFIKQLTVVAVSMITNLKDAFPEDCYCMETFGGLRLKILNKSNNCSDDLAQFVSTALQQAFEAFDKKYIHQLVLCFYENSCEPENLIEYHLFEYSYKSDGVILNINSKNRNSDKRSIECSFERVKTKTTMLLKTLSMYIMGQSHQKLPVNFDISLRLYYNEDAPEGYQAPGFSSTSAQDHIQPTLEDAVRLASVDTPYHSIVARSYTRDQFPASDQAVPSLNAPVMTQADKNDFQGSLSTLSDSTAEPKLRCLCNQFDVDDQALITCKYCGTQQHAICFGFLSNAPPEHCCGACFDQNPARLPSDAKLLRWDSRRRECLCVFRRTLHFCLNLSTIDGHMIEKRFGMTSISTIRMIKLMQSHNIVPNTSEYDLTVRRKINIGPLNRALKRFFHVEETEQDTMVDRLMAETAAAHDMSDPIGDVLSPIEKMSLHNTSNLGQVINSIDPSKSTRSDDKTLEQYRGALLINYGISEELPLSGSHNPVKNVEKIGKKQSMKRKNDDEDWLPKLRSGAKTKKLRQ